jgi:predicted nucleic acid-binding protein
LAAFETGAALSRRFRDGLLMATQLEATLASLRADLERLIIVEVAAPLFPAVLRLTRRHALRSADAIHLASCLTLQESLGEEIPFVVFDRRLATAARAEGIETIP